MTTFSYSSGNPSNLVGGSTANMTDISGSFTDVRTFLNGSIDTTNLATSAKPATLLGPYRTVGEAANSSPGTVTTSGDFLLTDSGAHPTKSPASVTSSDPIYLYLNGSDYAASGLTAKLRVRGTVLTNGTAPANTLTFGLYPITPSGGVNVLTFTMGTVVTGSTAAVASPSANSATTAASSDFSFPTAGAYALGFAASAGQAANSVFAIHVRLEYHHV